MCGIFAAIGTNNILTDMKPALERLSYRGYDSAGITSVVEGKLETIKCVGHPESLPEQSSESSVSIAHNRWATHGLPTEKNAHPHISNDKKIALVHNGIIENYLELKKFLEDLGYIFYSDTDTEIIPNLIQHFYEKTSNIIDAVKASADMLQGAYAVVFIHLDFPEDLFVLKLGSPICLGLVGENTYVSSDINSLPFSTEKAVTLEDNRLVRIGKKANIKTFTMSGASEKLIFESINIEKNNYSLGEYSSFLEKEINEQVIYSKNAIAGRINSSDKKIRLSGVSENIQDILDADEIIFTGCGSAFYAAQIGAYTMESMARKRCRAIPAGELKYFNAVLDKGTVMIAVSQSGETADTLGCIKTAKDHGALTLGIVNVPNSSIAREVSSGIHIRAGQEISVASTKAVVNQVLSLISLSALVASKKDLSKMSYANIVDDIYSIPEVIERTLGMSDQIRAVAKNFFESKSLICIGRDIMQPVASEAALKIKEISYIHAEGYSASELKHGPLALIDKGMPTLSFTANGMLEEKILSNLMEIKSRSGPIINVVDDKCRSSMLGAGDYNIVVPSTRSRYTSVIPMLVVGQLMSLYLAQFNERPIDRPRNLAKSVTVE